MDANNLIHLEYPEDANIRVSAMFMLRRAFWRSTGSSVSSKRSSCRPDTSASIHTSSKPVTKSGFTAISTRTPAIFSVLKKLTGSIAASKSIRADGRVESGGRYSFSLHSSDPPTAFSPRCRGKARFPGGCEPRPTTVLRLVAGRAIYGGRDVDRSTHNQLPAVDWPMLIFAKNSTWEVQDDRTLGNLTRRLHPGKIARVG